MKQKINGFIVVRKPEYNGMFFNGKWVPDPAVHNSNKYYGIERSAWEDICDAYYGERLSHELTKIYRKISSSTDWLITGVLLSRSEEEVKKVLKYSNRNKKDLCELIAFYSDVVTDFQGEFETDVDINWIGYDVAKIGAWSLIRHGIFRCDDFFNKWKKKLNSYSLLTEINDSVNFEEVKELIKDYTYYEEKDLVEKLTSYKHIDPIKIGIVS